MAEEHEGSDADSRPEHDRRADDMQRLDEKIGVHGPAFSRFSRRNIVAWLWRPYLKVLPRYFPALGRPESGLLYPF